MKKIVLDIYNIIKSNFKSIFIFEIIYRIVSLTVLVRIFEIAVGYILKGSGNSYLNPKNIGTIFTNPLTYPVLIGMILILILVGHMKWRCFMRALVPQLQEATQELLQ